MNKIDGQGEPLLSGKEMRITRPEAAGLEKRGEELAGQVSGHDQVLISTSKRKRDALTADLDRLSRLKREAGVVATKQAGGILSNPALAQPGPVDDFTSGIEISNSYARETFKNCLPNTLKTTVSQKDDNTTFTITGDIPAMWVRDSCAQIHPYVYMCKDDPQLQRVINGTILRHVKHFNSSVQDAPIVNSWKDDYSPWEYKFEPDGIAYLTRLCSLYTATSGDDSWAKQTGDFDAHKAFNKALDLIKEKTGPTGMVRCTHRPSDDETKYPYLIPTNMFLASTLPKLKDMYLNLWNDPARAKECDEIANRIRTGIETHARVNHPVHGTIYAYEVDDNGNSNLMDDANVPSLLAAPYLEYCSPSDPIYRNTRNFVLSSDNPYFHSGSQGAGIGSPHTPGKRIWPMAITMQALTSNDPGEIRKSLASLDKLDAGTHYMHEGVNPDNPNEYSRGWFSWANSLYSELVIKKVMGLNYIPGEGTYVKPSLNPEWNRISLNQAVPFGDISAIKLQASGEGSQIVSATVNGKPVPIDPEKGIKITEDPADVVIQTAPTPAAA